MSVTQLLSVEYQTTWTEDEERHYFKGKDEYLLKVTDGVIEYIGLERPYSGFAVREGYPDEMINYVEKLREKYIGKTPKEFYQSLPKPRGKMRVKECSLGEDIWHRRCDSFEDELKMAQRISRNEKEESFVELNYRYASRDEGNDPSKVLLKMHGNKIVGAAIDYHMYMYPENLDEARKVISYCKEQEEKFLGHTLKEAFGNIDSEIADKVFVYATDKDEWQKESRKYSRRLMIAQRIKDGKEEKFGERLKKKRAPKDPLQEKAEEFEGLPLYPKWGDDDFDRETEDNLKERKKYMHRNSSKARAKRAEREAANAAQGEDKLRERKRSFKSLKVKEKDDNALMWRKKIIKRQRGIEE